MSIVKRQVSREQKILNIYKMCCGGVLDMPTQASKALLLKIAKEIHGMLDEPGA